MPQPSYAYTAVNYGSTSPFGESAKLQVIALKKHPAIWEQFQADAPRTSQVLQLGQVYIGRIAEQVSVVRMVAQHGIGQSKTQRLRYAALCGKAFIALGGSSR
uniref:hypothetical protein n=1 Tax=Burkholderia sp. M701 TaxID=326454 RepID=UPI00097F7330|nr:hypothetical protein [Burkholderia sp. M701]